MGHFSEVVIGDENSSKFEPSLRIKKWGEESWLSFGQPTAKNFQASLAFDRELKTEVVQWVDSDADRKYRFYEKQVEKSEFGSLEFEIHLASAPAEEFIDFPFNASALDMIFQPTLAKIAIDGSSFQARGGGTMRRPANVNNSYALYHSSKGNLHSGDGDKYRTGKAFHLYRFQAVDAKGDLHWLDTKYSPEAGTISIVMDPWFQTAVYPVVIDPTFGFTSQGGSTDDASSNFIWAKAFANPASSGTLDSISSYVAKAINNTTFNPAIYSDVTSAPSARLAFVNSGGTALTSASISLITTPISYASLTSGIQYWFGLSNLNADNTSNNYFWAFDTGGSLNYKFDAGGGWPASASGGLTFADEKISVYGNYTAGGAAPRKSGLLQHFF